MHTSLVLKQLYLSLVKHWLKLGLIVFLLLPTLSFILASAGILAYIYWPLSYSKLSIPMLQPEAKHLFVMAHGLKDNSSSWSDPLELILNRNNAQQQVISLNWEDYASNPFRCSVAGRRIGEQLGSQLLELQHLQSLHLIGHSCGAFVVLGLCETIKAANSQIQVQTTYLDPVSIYGGLFWQYGLRHFGSCADYSEAYIDTEDDVPGSNQPLPLAHTFDVTELRKQSVFNLSPHLWPTRYYLERAERGALLELRDNAAIAEQYPAGVMERLD